MLRLRMAGTAVLVSAALAASALAVFAQTGPQPAGQGAEATQPPADPLARSKKRKKNSAPLPPQNFEESTRFLKSIPPKPAVQLPYPSIATPPIEDQAPVPLLTEAQQKKMEEELTRLGKTHGQPRAGKAKQAQPKAKPETAKKKPKAPGAGRPLPLTN